MTKQDVQTLCRGNDHLEWAAAGWLFAELVELIHHWESQPSQTDEKFLLLYVKQKVKEFEWHVQQEAIKTCRLKVEDAKASLSEYSEHGVG